jgi:hypothetical protein
VGGVTALRGPSSITVVKLEYKRRASSSSSPSLPRDLAPVPRPPAAPRLGGASQGTQIHGQRHLQAAAGPQRRWRCVSARCSAWRLDGVHIHSVRRGCEWLGASGITGQADLPWPDMVIGHARWIRKAIVGRLASVLSRGPGGTRTFNLTTRAPTRSMVTFPPHSTPSPSLRMKRTLEFHTGALRLRTVTCYPAPPPHRSVRGARDSGGNSDGNDRDCAAQPLRGRSLSLGMIDRLMLGHSWISGYEGIHHSCVGLGRWDCNRCSRCGCRARSTWRPATAGTPRAASSRRRGPLGSTGALRCGPCLPPCQLFGDDTHATAHL